MPTENIPIERIDGLVREAVVTVFESMVGEAVTWRRRSCLVSGTEGDMLGQLPLDGGIYAIVVSWLGDASGKVMLVLPRAAAERFALKLFDTPSLDWIEGEVEETLQDTMGELGNMLVGLVKGGLTKWYPKLMLTTPKVLKDKRMKVDTASMSVRCQYLFDAFDSQILVDFCCE